MATITCQWTVPTQDVLGGSLTSQPITGYVLERRTYTGATPGAWGVIANLAAGVTSYADSTAVLDVEYGYRYATTNLDATKSGTGVGPYSDEKRAKVLSAAPTGTTATFDTAATQGVHPASGAVSIVQPAGDACVFYVVGSSGDTAVAASGCTLLASDTSLYVKYHVFGKTGGAGATVSITGLTNQTAVVAIGIDGVPSNWLTASTFVKGTAVTGSNQSVVTGVVPDKALLMSFLGTSDATALPTYTAPSGMTLRASVQAQFNQRSAAAATMPTPSTVTQTLTWDTPVNNAGSSVASVLIIPPLV